MNTLAVLVTISDYWLTALISVFLPMIVAIITKQVASGTVKSLVLLLLAAITGTVTSWQATGGTFDVKDAVIATIMSFVVAVGIHFGLLSPTGVTGSEGALQRKTAGFGLGKG